MEDTKTEETIAAAAAATSLLRKQLVALGQEHILAGLSSCTDEQRQALLTQLASIDFQLFQRALIDVVHTLGSSSSSSHTRSASDPFPPPPFPRANWEGFEHWLPVADFEGEHSKGDTARWWLEGLRLVAAGHVAVLVLAGGQGTRLGPNAPAVKGMLELDIPPRPRSLFELQAEQLLLVQQLAALVMGTEVKLQIPWIVMTSDATDLPTRTFFEEKHFFGLAKSQVWFMKQTSLPCVELEKGHAILMDNPWKVALAPAGNGSVFSDLAAAGIVERLADQGIQYVQVYAVDNALARVADPVFYGFVHERKADIGVKVVAKKFPKEAVGVVCLHSQGSSPNDQRDRGVYGVIEYSEMSEELRTAEDSSGQLLFRAAHICINMFSVEYLKKLMDSEFQLEFHPAIKRISHIKDPVPGKPNGIKLEQFIFDAFKYCDPKKVALLEVDRDVEFAPIKNAVGPGVPDSPATALDLLLALHCRVHSTPGPDSSNIHHQEESTNLTLLKAYVGGQSRTVADTEI